MAPELGGIAIRLVEVPRFRAAMERFRPRLLERIFTPAEIAYGARKRHGAQNLAARFAAKCAGRDLLAGRTSPRVHLSDFEIVRRRSGEPTLVWRSGAEDELHMRVSLTHDADFAVASVWLERDSSA